MRDCQLAETHHYVLCLVSFLVGMGARSIWLDSQKDQLELRAEGLTVPENVLANPLEGLFSSQRSPALRELAIGINSALGYAGARIHLRSSDGFQGEYDNNAFICQPWPGEDKRETICTIKRRADPNLEREAVREHFACCPIAVHVQGQKISATLQAHADCLVVQICPAESGPGRHLQVAAAVVMETLTRPAPVYACIWVGGPVEPVCRWIFLGRTYQKSMPWQALRGELPIQMWVACDHLDKDLSLGRLIENERYAKVCEFLRQSFLQAIDGLLEQVLQPGQFSQAQMTVLRPLVIYAIEASARASAFALAMELQKRLVAVGWTPSQTSLDHYRLDLLRDSTRNVDLDLGSRPEPDQSLEELWEATRASLAIRGAQNHKTTQILYRCGEMAYEAGRYEIATTCLGPYLTVNPARSPAIRAQFGHSLLEVGRVHEARLHLEKSVASLRTDPDIPEWAMKALEHLATADAQLGNTKEAARALADLLRRRQALWGSRSRQLGLMLRRLAALCRKLDDPKTADHYESWSNQLDE
ncbi:tetratricopeptide repeat protein [bacterium]|nr:tetratricopeptide repeat protein [bacterium]